MSRHFVAAVGFAMLMLLAGCGGGVQQARPPRQVPGISASGGGIEEPAARAVAEEFDYHGWQAVRMSNDLVTLVVVPEIGGRILEYKLGARPLLWINSDELGRKYDADADPSVYHDFGGYHVQAVPEAGWQSPADARTSTLDAGRWTYQIITARGRSVEVELKSPADSEVTGLQITRTITLYAGTTDVQISEKVENISDRQVEWAIQHTSQMPGVLKTDAEFSPESKLYFPLNPDSKHKRRFAYLTEGGLAQFEPIEDNSLMEVSYQRQAGRIGADSIAGWVAHLDGISNYAFVQRFTPTSLQDYPEQDSTVTVRTATEHAYMEVGILTPVHTLAPGQSVESRLQWSATRLTGPVRDVTDVAAIHEPVQVTKSGEQFKLTGKIGVFAPGELVLTVRDRDGKPLIEPVKLAASLTEMMVLDQTLPVKEGAASVVVELLNPTGSPLGEVANLSVAPTIARADQDTGARATSAVDTDADKSVEAGATSSAAESATAPANKLKLDAGR